MNDGSILWPKGNEPWTMEIEMSMEPHASSSFGSNGWMVQWWDDANMEVCWSWHSYNNCPRFGFNPRYRNGANVAIAGSADDSCYSWGTGNYKMFDDPYTGAVPTAAVRGGRAPFPRTMAPRGTRRAGNLTA